MKNHARVVAFPKRPEWMDQPFYAPQDLMDYILRLEQAVWAAGEYRVLFPTSSRQSFSQQDELDDALAILGCVNNTNVT